MDSNDKPVDTRLSFQEAMDIVELPAQSGHESNSKPMKRYMGTRAAWLPGSDLPLNATSAPEGMPSKPPTYKAAFGGQVYAQSALATCRALVDAQKKKGVKDPNRLGLHTIHGYFTAPGLVDRPFIYDVTPITAARSFTTFSVTAHQPLSPSNSPARDHFPLADAALPPGPTCFTAITSFKAAEPHTAGGTLAAADSPPQQRFRDILSSRAPEAWPPSPPVDIDMVTALVGTDIVGSFPAVEMRKVDMRAYNADKPLWEKRELILYRLLRPLPSDGTDGWDANAHVCVHAYAVDRNGLTMLCNLAGIGDRFGRAASLSYSLVVHVNVAEAVMEGNGWWVQEAGFPRAGAGRGMIVSRVWSPGGVHVATEYQDGLCQAFEERRGMWREEKL